MDAKLANPDLVVARIAARQHGVLSLMQLRGAGLTKDAIRRRVQRGRLYAIHRGVYAIGHRPVSRRGYWMAATLALGMGAVLSHLSAAVLWMILPDRGGYPQVSVPGDGGRARRRGLVIHRSLTLTSSCCTLKERIPVTTVARTIEDIGRTCPEEDVRRAIRQAEYLGLPLGPAIKRDGTRSRVERRLLDLCRRHGIPMPEVNGRVGRFAVDFLWRDKLFAIETDGWAGHKGRESLEADHERGLELAKRGFELVRLTERQLKSEPEGVAAFLRERLNRPGS